MTNPAESHYIEMQRLQAVAVLATRRVWDKLDASNISASWSRQLTILAPVIANQQLQAAISGSEYGVLDLAERGTYVTPTVFVNPQAFSGVAASGIALEDLLYMPAVRTKQWIAAGYSTAQALQMGRSLLDGISRTTIADAGRQAASVDIAARPGVGYVRMLNPPSCDICTILAGKFYRWNAGFRRHPRCDCIHRPSKSVDAAKSEGLIDDPYKAFNELGESGQNRMFGKSNAKAIRDGGDIYQVVNSKRGIRNAMTTEGTTRRGYASTVLKPRQKRMTPDTIYRVNTTREAAIADLRAQGYILPAGQVPGGSLRGPNYEGFGALGRGGTRKAASQAVVTARELGVRDLTSRYTMTAAERRLYDAKNRYEVALSGRSPYTSPGFGSTPDPTGAGLNRVGAGYRPVTPKELARAEIDYRRWLRTNGEIFD